LSVIGYAGAFCLLGVAVGFAALWWRLRQARQALIAERGAIGRERADLAAVLATVPVARFCFAAEQKAALPDGYAAFLAGLAPGDAARLEAARLTLQRDATGFSPGRPPAVWASFGCSTGRRRSPVGSAMPQRRRRRNCA
jgi:hypothetical protein